MTICDNCIHDEVCGLEGHLDEALTFCANKAADVQPVKRGHWIDMGDHEQCSECKATRLKEFQSYYGKVTRWEKTNFCPNCGADMRSADATKG